MLIKMQDVLQVIVHRDPETDGLSVEKNFDEGDVIPWSRPVVYKLCDGDDCFPADWQDKNPAETKKYLAAAVDNVQRTLTSANNAYVSAAVARGEKTVTIHEVTAELACGTTHVYNLIKSGEFPEPSHISGKSAWLRSEVLHAKAMLIAKPSDKRRSPMNRHERRKAAAKTR